MPESTQRLLSGLLGGLELGVTVGKLLLQRVDLTAIRLFLLPQFLDLGLDAGSFGNRLPVMMDRLWRIWGAGRGLRVASGHSRAQRKDGERLQLVSHSASQELEIHNDEIAGGKCDS